jgi:hypothetical protein
MLGLKSISFGIKIHTELGSSALKECEDTTKSWVIEIQCPTKKPLWTGNIYASCRFEAKKLARKFVSEHFLDAKILRIARGHISIVFYEEPEEF